MKKLSFVLLIAIISVVGVLVGVNVAGTFSEEQKQQVLVAQSQKEIVPTTQTAVTQPLPEVGIPTSIRIPQINVTGQIEQVGLDSKKAMDVPKDADNAAWYKLGPRPGQIGNAVFAGHFDKESGAPAIFYDLTSLRKGDEIIITDDQGKELTFFVIRMVKYPYNSFPIGEVFGKTDKTMLNLITCHGDWSSSSKNYSHRYVIYAELSK
ncbi:MAG: class F sortase [Patescibacteria group bacterium]